MHVQHMKGIRNNEILKQQFPSIIEGSLIKSVQSFSDDHCSRRRRRRELDRPLNDCAAIRVHFQKEKSIVDVCLFVRQISPTIGDGRGSDGQQKS